MHPGEDIESFITSSEPVVGPVLRVGRADKNNVLKDLSKGSSELLREVLCFSTVCRSRYYHVKGNLLS